MCLDFMLVYLSYPYSGLVYPTQRPQHWIRNELLFPLV